MEIARLFDQYRSSLGRDGPDASILRNATGPDREQLESDLIDYLSIDAAFAADGLRIMKSESALPQLKAALEAADSATRAHLCRALWEVENDEKWITAIASAIETAPSPTARTQLMGLFHHVKHPMVFAALEAAMFDSDYSVRCTAAFYYSTNSARQTADSTIQSNLLPYDEGRIHAFINRLRAKIDG